MVYEAYTHIANGSKSYVWAKVDSSKIVLESINLNGVSIKNMPSSLTAGYTRISPKSFIRIKSGGFNFIFKTTVYVAIYKEDGDTLRPLTTGFLINCDGSVIVTQDNCVVNTLYGKVWVDEAGEDFVGIVAMGEMFRNLERISNKRIQEADRYLRF